MCFYSFYGKKTIEKAPMQTIYYYTPPLFEMRGKVCLCVCSFYALYYSPREWVGRRI